MLTAPGEWAQAERALAAAADDFAAAAPGAAPEAELALAELRRRQGRSDEGPRSATAIPPTTRRCCARPSSPGTPATRLGPASCWTAATEGCPNGS